MLFDDRLATVLRHRAGGERAAATQLRQLIDLLGDARLQHEESLEAAAYLRLDALIGMIPAASRSAIVAQEARRIRTPGLAMWFAGADPSLAAPALAREIGAGERGRRMGTPYPAIAVNGARIPAASP